VTDPASNPRNAAPTIPAPSCPNDRKLTAICRQVVRNRKDKVAQRELAEEVVARMNAELLGRPE
jgi:hypothetical protein